MYYSVRVTSQLWFFVIKPYSVESLCLFSVSRTRDVLRKARTNLEVSPICRTFTVAGTQSQPITSQAEPKMSKNAGYYVIVRTHWCDEWCFHSSDQPNAWWRRMPLFAIYTLQYSEIYFLCKSLHSLLRSWGYRDMAALEQGSNNNSLNPWPYF